MKPRRVLIVDDDRAVLFVLCNALRRSPICLGFEVDSARSGAEALERAASDSYELLVTDLKMPGMNGVSLTESMRQLRPRIRVIWMTAYGCHRVRPDAIRLGVSRCLEKPLGIEAFRKAVSDVLEDEACGSGEDTAGRASPEGQGVTNRE